MRLYRCGWWHGKNQLFILQHMMYFFVFFFFWHTSLVNVGTPLSCYMCVTDLQWKPWQFRLWFSQMPMGMWPADIALEGRRNCPLRTGGVKCIISAFSTDDGPATCGWMGVTRMLRWSNKQSYLLQPRQIINEITLSLGGFLSKVHTIIIL